MSQRKKLEQVLELLINEESDRAEELLHDIVVEKARTIYESLVNEEDDEDEEDIEESFGGDPKEEFIGEVEADMDDIESDEIAGGELDDEMGMEYGEDDIDGEGDFEDEGVDVKIDELSAQIAELKDMFASEMGLEDEADFEDEEAGFEAEAPFGDEEESYMEDLEEATKLQDPVADPGMKKEGKLTGTGKHSKTGATGTEAPYTKAPTKSLNGADPVDFTKGATGGEYNGPAGGDSETAKDDTPSSNIDVSHKQEDPVNLTGAGTGQNTEGKFSGTGKNSKTGATQTKSPLTKAPKHP